jgi:hypothetical protein
MIFTSDLLFIDNFSDYIKPKPRDFKGQRIKQKGIQQYVCRGKETGRT